MFEKHVITNVKLHKKKIHFSPHDTQIFVGYRGGKNKKDKTLIFIVF
jgi:hypothetical protein